MTILVPTSMMVAGQLAGLYARAVVPNLQLGRMYFLHWPVRVFEASYMVGPLVPGKLRARDFAILAARNFKDENCSERPVLQLWCLVRPSGLKEHFKVLPG